MTDVHVSRDSFSKLARVEGELKVGRRAKIEALDGNVILVSERACFEGAAEINSNLECDSLTAEHGGTLTVNGDLVVHRLLDVAHSIDVKGTIRAGEIDVGSKVYAKSIVCAGRVRAGSFLKIKETLEASSVDVAGQVEVGGLVKLQDLNVGGVAEVGGGSILGKIRIGGKFVSKNPLDFGDMEVVGKVILSSRSKGRRISSFGRLNCSDIECDELELKGRTEIRGECKARTIDASGKLDVRGSVQSSDVVVTWGQTKISGDLIGEVLRLAGHVEAKRIFARNEVELMGQSKSDEGMKGNVILFRSGSKYLGVLVGNSVNIGSSSQIFSNWGIKFAGQNLFFRLVGKETSVGDVYAEKVHLGQATRCGRIFAETVEFEEGCTAEEVNYTKEIRGPIDKVFFNKPFPKKVVKLPEPPL